MDFIWKLALEVFCLTCFLDVQKHHDVATIDVEAKIVLKDGIVTDKLWRFENLIFRQMAVSQKLDIFVRRHACRP